MSVYSRDNNTIFLLKSEIFPIIVETMTRLAFLIAILAFSTAPAMDGSNYRRRLESGDRQLNGDLSRTTSRITNRETAFVVARHLGLLLGDAVAARGLLPQSGPEPHEETLLGLLDEAEGRPNDALFHYDRAWARSGHRYDRAPLCALKLLIKKKSLAEARLRSVELIPFLGDGGDLALVRSVVYLGLGDLPAAETTLGRTALWGPVDESTRSLYFRFRGLLWEARGSNALALSCWRTANLLDPSDLRCRVKVQVLSELIKPQGHWLDTVKPGQSLGPTTKTTEGAEGEDQGGWDGASLTARQVKNQASAILKLVTGPAVTPHGQQAHREAWDRLETLEQSGGSALALRFIWACRAQLAQVAHRPQMARAFLDRANRSPPTDLLDGVFLPRLDAQVALALQASREQKERVSAMGADLLPEVLATAMLEEILSPPRLCPIPQSVLDSFDIPEGPLAPITLVAETNDETPEPQGLPNRRLHRLGGRLVGIDLLTWDDQGRLTRRECREVDNRGTAGVLWQTTTLEYPGPGLRKEITRDPGGQILQEVTFQTNQINNIPTAVQEVWVEGRLTEITTTKDQSTRVQLPGGEVTREVAWAPTATGWRQTVSRGGEVLWTDDTTFLGPDPVPGTETRRERRDSLGNLMEVFTRRWVGLKPVTEERRAPDGALLESWQWVW